MGRKQASEKDGISQQSAQQLSAPKLPRRMRLLNRHLLVLLHSLDVLVVLQRDDSIVGEFDTGQGRVEASVLA